jgi:hypothetical protein
LTEAVIGALVATLAAGLTEASPGRVGLGAATTASGCLTGVDGVGLAEAGGEAVALIGAEVAAGAVGAGCVGRTASAGDFATGVIAGGTIGLVALGSAGGGAGLTIRGLALSADRGSFAVGVEAIGATAGV